jgi:hypothetical protein
MAVSLKENNWVSFRIKLLARKFRFLTFDFRMTYPEVEVDSLNLKQGQFGLGSKAPTSKPPNAADL